PRSRTLKCARLRCSPAPCQPRPSATIEEAVHAAFGGSMRLWGGRFGGEPAEAGEAERIAAFGRSVEIDRELALDDLDGSIAHVRGLGRAGILTDDEVGALVAGLADLRRDVEDGSFAWDPSLEDVHLNLEA